MGQFSDMVYDVVRRIPRGYVLSYGDVARMIGQPRKSRFVGFALRNNPEPWSAAHDGGESGVPCHRVVFADGKLADNFVFGGIDVQRGMLEREGVAFTSEGNVDMQRCRWDGRSLPGSGDFPTTPPPDFDWNRELGDL